MKTKICEVCATSFEVTTRYERKTCSKECNYKLVAERTRSRAVDNISKNCTVCTQEFTTRFWKKDKTCSKQCKSKLISSNLKGRAKTAEHCSNISEALKNSEKAKRTQFKKGKENPAYGRSQTGPANHNWKGGNTNSNQKKRNDPRMEEWRKSVFEKDSYTCQKCGTKGFLQAHHIIPFSQNFEKAFDVSNGLTVCVPCHELIHGRFIGKFKQKL